MHIKLIKQQLKQVSTNFTPAARMQMRPLVLYLTCASSIPACWKTQDCSQPCSFEGQFEDRTTQTTGGLQSVHQLSTRPALLLGSWRSSPMTTPTGILLQATGASYHVGLRRFANFMLFVSPVLLNFFSKIASAMQNISPAVSVAAKRSPYWQHNDAAAV
jgi:hypothetical protein